MRDEYLAEELLKILSPLSLETPKTFHILRDMSDEEGRFLFQKLIDAQKIPPPPYDPSAPLFPIVLSKIEATKSPLEGMRWLSLIKLTSLSRRHKIPLKKALDNLLSQKSDPPAGSDGTNIERGCLLLNRAKLAYGDGDIPLVLTLLRRILIDQESTQETEIERKAESLATTIVDEYRYDQAILGTIHSLFPRSLWGKLFINLSIEHALRGESREFERVLKLIEQTQIPGNAMVSTGEKNILRALASRNPTAMKQAWDRLIEENLRVALRFSLKLGERALSLKPNERKGVDSYLKIMEKTLATLREKGHPPNQLDQIILLLSSSSPASERYEEGRATVLGSTVHAGAVSLRDDTTLEKCPYEWSAPKVLALRPLLPRLKHAVGDDWEIR